MAVAALKTLGGNLDCPSPEDAAHVREQAGVDAAGTAAGLVAAHAADADQHLPPQAGQAGKYLTTDGTAAAWQTVVGGGPVRVYYASQVGAVPDASTDPAVTTTAGFTDSTAALQAVLDTASASAPLTLVLDGAYCVSGLRVKSGTRIVADHPTHGLILKDGSHAPLLRGYTLSKSTTGVNGTPSNLLTVGVTISGGTYHGNYRNQLRTHPTYTQQLLDGVPSASRWPWSLTVGFLFVGIERLVVEDVFVHSHKTYAVMLSNAQDFLFRDVRTDYISIDGDANGRVNADGLHLIGPLLRGTVRNYTVRSGDDAIALLANDGATAGDPGTAILPDGSPENCGYGPSVTCGAVYDVAVDGVTLAESSSGWRLLSAASPIDRVSFSRVVGQVSNHLGIVATFPQAELEGGPGPGAVGTVTFSDLSPLTLPGSLPAFQIGCRIDQLEITRLVCRDLGGRSALIGFNEDADVGVARLSDLTQLAGAGPVVSLAAGGAIGSLLIDRPTVRRASPSAGAGVVRVDGGTVDYLRVGSPDVDGASRVVQTAGAVGELHVTPGRHRYGADGTGAAVVHNSGSVGRAVVGTLAAGSAGAVWAGVDAEEISVYPAAPTPNVVDPLAAFEVAPVFAALVWSGAVDLYQDSGRTTPATADADPVGGWADRAASPHHLGQATAGKRPTRIGRAVRFDGTERLLSTASGWAPTGSDPRTLAFRVTRRAAATAFLVAMGAHGTGGNWFGVYWDGTGAVIASNWGVSLGGSVAPLDTPISVVLVYGGGTWRLHVGDHGSADTPITLTTPDAPLVVGDATGQNLHPTADFHEIEVWDVALTPEQVDAVIAVHASRPT